MRFTGKQIAVVDPFVEFALCVECFLSLRRCGTFAYWFRRDGMFFDDFPGFFVCLIHVARNARKQRLVFVKKHGKNVVERLFVVLFQGLYTVFVCFASVKINVVARSYVVVRPCTKCVLFGGTTSQCKNA